MYSYDRRAVRRPLPPRALLKPPLKKQELDDLVEHVVALARVNARETEGVGQRDRSKPHDPDWEARVNEFLRSSIDSILDSLQSSRECRNYGLEEPLNARQFQEVARKCRAQDQY